MGSSAEKIVRVALVFLGVSLAGPAAARSGCSPDEVDLRWQGGEATFHVEWAISPEERAKGLMFRDSLAPNQGMLFVFERPQSVSFWMKNTLIPLDMLFVSADGTVQKIARMAVPGDETPIPGGANVKYVLEIMGGRAAELGLTDSVVMRHVGMEPSQAKWPCDAP